GRFEKPSYNTQRIWKKAAGEVLTAKQAPHRPGTAPALGLRAGMVAVAIIIADRLQKEIVNYVAFLDPEFPEPEFAPHPDPTPSLTAPATGATPANPRSARGPDRAVVHGFAGPE